MKLYSIETNDKIPDDFKYAFWTIPAAQNQKQTSIGVLAKLIKLNIDQKESLRVNIEIKDCLFDSQTGNIEFAY